MFDASAISRLYATVLHYDIRAYGIHPQRVKEAIEVIAVVYSPESTNFQSTHPMLADYNDVVYRCAYLHKYAPLHTHIVYGVMMEILRKEKLLFRKLMKTRKFHICSLGGGPGSDVIGVLAALRTVVGSYKTIATVVDYMQDWEFTFKSIVDELISGGYGEAWYNLAEDFRWKYVGTDLLFRLTGEAETAVATSSLVTMIKFVSAAVCKNTDDMLKTIFSIMKPGALLLYVDNAGGGFSRLIEKAARENGFVILFGPLKHVQYIEGTFKVKRFGHNGCCSTTVTIFLLQKQMNQLATVNHNVDERTPLLHGRKKRKSSDRKSLKENQILNNHKVLLPPDNGDSKFGTIQNISQDLLDKTQPVPNLPSPLLPIKYDPNHSLGKKISSQKPFQEKQIDPNYPGSLSFFSSHSRIVIGNFKPADPARKSDYSLPECSGYSQITVPDTESDMDVQEIDSKKLQSVLQSGTVIRNSLIHETTESKRSQKVRIVPQSSNPLPSAARNDTKSDTLAGRKNRSLAIVFPVTTQPVSVAGIACSASSHQPSVTGRNICRSESKSSNASEIPTLQDKFNEASRLMNSRIPSLLENRKQNNVSPENSHKQKRIFPASSNGSVSNNNYSKPETSEQMNCEGSRRTVNSVPNYSTHPVVTIQPSSVAHINATRHRLGPKPPQRDMEYLESDSCCPCSTNTENYEDYEEEVCCPKSCYS